MLLLQRWQGLRDLCEYIHFSICSILLVLGGHPLEMVGYFPRRSQYGILPQCRLPAMLLLPSCNNYAPRRCSRRLGRYPQLTPDHKETPSAFCISTGIVHGRQVQHKEDRRCCRSFWTSLVRPLRKLQTSASSSLQRAWHVRSTTDFELTTPVAFLKWTIIVPGFLTASATATTNFLLSLYSMPWWVFQTLSQLFYTELSMTQYGSQVQVQLPDLHRPAPQKSSDQ